jgi:hypothetical protein
MDEDYGDGIDEYLSQIYDELVAHGFNPVHDQDDLIPIVIGDETNIMHLEPRYMWIYGVQTKMIEEKYF